MTRKTEGLLIALGILIGVAVIQSMAVAWGPKSDCTFHLPSIIGCALASYENLSGGLIAAGGALFAGWLAWSAVNDQIRLEKQKMYEVTVEQLHQRATDVSAELSALRTAFSNGEYMLRLLQEGRTDPSPNARKFIELSNRQVFPAGIDGWHSRIIGTTLWEAAIRVRDVARHIEREANMYSADQRVGYLLRREPDAQEALENFSSVLSRLPGLIKQQEANLTDENRMVALAQADLRRLRGS